MSRDTTRVLRQLRRLMRAYDRFSRAVGGPSAGEAELDAVFEDFMNAFETDWSTSVNDLIANARRSLQTDQEAIGHPQPNDLVGILTEEAASMRELNIDVERLKWFYSIYEQHREVRDQFPATAAELRTRLNHLHESAKQQLSNSRGLNRREKKKRKRKVGQGVLSLTAGTGAIIADTNFPALAAFSYGLGCGALIQAARDLIGEPGE